MIRFLLAALVVCWFGCSPGYQSGETQCSEQDECPSGFICSESGSTATHICVTRPEGCADQYSFYCPASRTCWPSAVACSTVFNCGTSAAPDYSACLTAGYHPDCTGTSCIADSSGTGGAGGRSDAGAGGAGGAAGGATGTGTSADAGVCPPPAAGGTCNVFPACGCPAGTVCYPKNMTAGLACYPTAGLGEGAACDDMCAAGLGCFGSVCKPYCQSDSDCPLIDSARSCKATYWDDTNTIAGVFVCVRVCDPVSPQNPRSPLLACPAGFGCSSAGTTLPGASNCIEQPGTGVTDSACSSSEDCTPGYYCSNGGTCIRYCYTAADCPAGVSCISFSTPSYAGTVEVKHCAPAQ
jgi:hypothetical protein